MPRKKTTTLLEYQQLGLLTKLIVKISYLLFNEMARRFPANSTEFKAGEKMIKAIDHYQCVMDNKVCGLPIKDNHLVINIFYGSGIFPNWSLEEAYKQVLTLIEIEKLEAYKEDLEDSQVHLDYNLTFKEDIEQQLLTIKQQINTKKTKI
jgi:hypothetical protein